ncbi:hypothetical protein CJF40_05555 [Pseudomonas lundensis]|uniref:Integrase catalytic domain-containing protein n=1 Tax=Pseudomonas lundensis TaxID=86185 RepID=A0ABX4GQA4_9PSED|nr:hypothetical protein CJF40_05555 [Pseudomonas lundensis]OZY55840.1 hypothetical protein CJF38_08145 [Pseudomonas lundensis]
MFGHLTPRSGEQSRLKGCPVSFRSLKTEWILTTGYRTAQEAQRDIRHFLMHWYNCSPCERLLRRHP